MTSYVKDENGKQKEKRKRKQHNKFHNSPPENYSPSLPKAPETLLIIRLPVPVSATAVNGKSSSLATTIKLSKKALIAIIPKSILSLLKINPYDVNDRKPEAK